MGKINLKAKLISEEENLNIEISGIKTNNKIVYKENDITVTILILNNRIEMNRTCNEYKINLIFEENKKTISSYQVFGMPKTFDLETNTKKLLIKDNEIDLNYNLEGNDFKYSLVWEVRHENNIEKRN
ncbi:MAG: DUF1934 domain-containing protein [Bacilli bacterium]|nr:DUF1934 domain-containing protein [Bacilli bacterium]